MPNSIINYTKKLLIILACFLLAFALISCGEVDKDLSDEGTDIASIYIDQETVPTTAVATQVDLSQIKLIVLLKNGDTRKVELTEDMIAMSDGWKLNTEGVKTIGVVYGGKETKFFISLEKPPIMWYSLTIINGTRQGDEPIEGNWEGTIRSGDSVTIEAISKEAEGFIFDYWAIGGEKINENRSFDYVIERNVTITAVFKERLHKVIFDSLGGSAVPQQEVRVIEECPIPTKSENVFIQWYDESISQAITFPYYVTRETTLKAIWEPLGLRYERSNSEQQYTIVGYNFDGPRTILEIPSMVGSGDDENFVMRIARGAFENATTLEKIIIPSTITQIEDYAFINCINLTEIIIKGTSNNYKDIDGVLYNKNGDTLLCYPPGRMTENYVVGFGTDKIGKGAFYNANLGSIKISSHLDSIGDYAFYSRTVSFISFEGDVDSSIGYSENIFHDNLKEIFIFNPSYFDNYVSCLSFKPYIHKLIQSTETPNIEVYGELMYRIISRDVGNLMEQSLEIIGAKRNITSIIIPSHLIDERKVTSIGAYAFSYCYELEEIEFHQNMYVNRVLLGAFDNTKWQSNYIQAQANNWSGLLIINQMVMGSFENREMYTIPYNVTKICESSFSNLSRLKEIQFAVDNNNNKSIYEIHARAFENCNNLTKIIIPKQVKVLGERAFENTALYAFSFEPNSELHTIGDYCFQNAGELTSFDIGINVTKIGNGAFNGCYALEKFTINGVADSLYSHNNHFIVKDGVLFEFDKNITGDTDTFGQILKVYPSAKLQDVYVIPSENDVIGVTLIYENAFYYANVGAIVLPKTIERIMPRAIVVPNLLYLQFSNDETRGTSYKALFPEFGPKYVAFPNGNSGGNKTQWWQDGNIIRTNEIESMDICLGVVESNGQRFLYRKDDDVVAIIGGSRVEREIVVPSNITIDSNNYLITIIAGYAFMGNVIESVSISQNIGTVQAYAFYYCQSILNIISNKQLPPTLEHLSFHPETMEEKVLVFVPQAREHIYATSWGIDVDYVLEIGTQLVVKFNAKGGTNPIIINPETNEPYDLDTLDIIFESPTTTRVGYDFMGWYDNEIYLGDAVLFPYSKYKKITLYASWQVKSYAITYQLYGGEIEGEQNASYQVSYDKMYTLPIPAKKGYDFIGWYYGEIAYTDDQGQSISEWKLTNDVELIAKWSLKEIVIVYNADGGTTVEEQTTVTYLSNSFVFEIPIRAGYEFLGWKDANGTPLTNKNGENINAWDYAEDVVEIIANWLAKSFQVSFDDGQGTAISPVEIMFDTTNYTFFVPEKEGSVFFGWYSGEGGTDIQYTDNDGRGIRRWNIASDTTLYAQWPDDVYTLQDLKNINNKLEGSFILKNDIIIEGEWEPIGADNNNPFTGILDGNGFSVYNMSITNNHLEFVGFIGYNQGIIRNLNLGIKNDKSNYINRAQIIMENNEIHKNIYVGGLVGFNDISGRVINCKVASEMHLELVVEEGENYVYVGGIIGYNKGKIESTYVRTEISTYLDDGVEPNNIHKGALVGYHEYNAVILNCNFDIILPQGEQASYQPLGNYSEGSKGGYFNTTGFSSEGDWE